ncbi:hypothetical protein ACWDZ4_19605 [Streptomyces sp. NPDC003016]
MSQGPTPRTRYGFPPPQMREPVRGALHALLQTPSRTSVIGPNSTRHEEYPAADGSVAVEVDHVPGIGHGTPVDPGDGTEQCGGTGAACFPDSIHSSHWITQFFGPTESGSQSGSLPAPPGPTTTGATDTGLTVVSSPTSTVAARDADGKTGPPSSTGTAWTTGVTAACWTDGNYARVRSGRATTSGGYAKAPQQNTGLYDT